MNTIQNQNEVLSITYQFYFDNGMGNVVKLADVIRKMRKYAFQIKYPYFLEEEGISVEVYSLSTNRAA